MKEKEQVESDIEEIRCSMSDPDLMDALISLVRGPDEYVIHSFSARGRPMPIIRNQSQTTTPPERGRVMLKRLDDWSRPEAIGRCEKCGRPGCYVEGEVVDEEWEIIHYLSADCDEMGPEVTEACLAPKH